MLGAIRRVKSEQHRSVRARVLRCSVSAPGDVLGLVSLARDDLTDAANIGALELVATKPGSELRVELDLEPE